MKFILLGVFVSLTYVGARELPKMFGTTFEADAPFTHEPPDVVKANKFYSSLNKAKSISGIPDTLRIGTKLGVIPPRQVKFATVSSYYFSQLLDHNSNLTTTWSQMYQVNGEFYKGGSSPIFLMVGGESPADPAWLQGGAWYNWAQRYGAYMIQLEHRYFGQSLPTSDASTPNLVYLRSQQAIADVATFIKAFSSYYGLTANKWILFGGSYPGNLVAWARLKFGTQVYGSVSSSGPLQATSNNVDYNNVIGNSLDYFSPGCSSGVRDAFAGVLKLMQSSTGLQTLASKFPICQGSFNASNPLDRVVFVEGLKNPIAKMVQYNNQIPGGINQVCQYMNNQSNADPVDRLSKYYNATNQGNCVYGSYAGFVQYYQQTSWQSSAVSQSARQWYFLLCNELGFFQTSEQTNSTFSNSVPVTYYWQMCQDVFGSVYNATNIQKNVDFTNSYYQGKNISVQRVVFVQGSVDPWYPLGMITNPTSQSPLLFINGTSHCYDMLPPTTSDSAQLQQTRNTVQSNLDSWLGFTAGK